MSDKRRSRRMNYLGSGWLQHNGGQYYCRFENISIHGALVDLKDLPIVSIQDGEIVCLRLHLDAGGPKYRDFTAKVVHFDSVVAGLEFFEVEGASKDLLEDIVTKESHLFDGAAKILNLAREVAEERRIKLTAVHFDRGELIPEREIHTLRLFAGEHTAKAHLHREQIEEFYVNEFTLPAHMEVHKAIDRLWLQEH
ncbi:MAG: PilZ domain-containing protein [Desulfuromonadaceae bacterium]|nr:PilZ domain-containing protein [Desulfuromonadaceae bacterium]